MIRLLIVDDSALMRRHLQKVFEAEGDFDIEMARNGLEAIKLSRQFDPDVITLDINMPEMDGLTALSMLMAEQPRSVVMFSSLTEQGAIASLEALALGAVDFFPKPGGTISLNIDQVRDSLVAKVRAAAGAQLKKVGRSRNTSAAPTHSRAERKPVEKAVEMAADMGEGLVLIGSSTGGPRTLEEILPKLPASYPWPIVVSQHMPANFTRAFAERMNNVCALTVVEVSKPMPLEPGTVYIGMGASDVCISRRANRPYALPKPESNKYLWHPSVSLMVETAMQHFQPTQLIGVMLTGMGYDGADEMTELKRRGGRTLAESEASSVVFGMPAELIRRGGAMEVMACTEMAATLIRWGSSPTKSSRVSRYATRS
ncbi:chemotaxis response regulator protein-glutamate methylesterase 3 [Pseudomonas asuensis]|uniref:Protein-glutamate methylesterase/protein-glutamine glutaminase n=1 Tax=Pseudomonas asuensis TaxID=1825787 RepID=A0ABQ2GKN1_9PSED|nr:chemotaxis-specific protein-glutamate methyltransferase CheB [Pseudomonas asuensis]GGM00081.1 chemotaxis response regulator protein-glutamate methylesterase 3 [Pseudomonas asuensis]